MKKEVVNLKSAEDIEKLRKSNLVVAEVLEILSEMVVPGATLLDLERRAEIEVNKRGVRAAFKGYRGFPFCLCTSVNEVVVHGMPSDRVLNAGDIVSIDFGVECDGFYGDSARTIAVGEISNDVRRLVDVTKKSLDLAIEAMIVGNTLKDISKAIQGHVESRGFSVVRAFVGHGIGKNLHEAPQVPNFVMPGLDLKLKEGMVLAIEPMINVGTPDIKILEDGWTAVTTDGALSAHFEHSVAVTSKGPYVLSRI
ncbi:MAG: type I methionyl aminopeptidase [Proteobacteria bacterium]|nr:type I methionyl aminopeptidase [Pseudomonadota bacterium]